MLGGSIKAVVSLIYTIGQHGETLLVMLTWTTIVSVWLDLEDG